ncbi:DUF4160 domain-containing protein [Dolichospermum sp. FACHB-1091]|jgi:hypothetical protein|uniref:DUF4160 domain-containing protein n=1 Tax=Dolichospermum sp. FACHB-1091 TaxID=2692798 RepID=UPI0016807812|nr:DUF4160 domain-containing protein [Dolichospermum sp. FACHB-1091]MBD2444328.1 DUF4160 domain-containing protein [Dolichospermum sp. FACHB-1091]
MPTVIRIGHFRFHFYSDEGSEPPHIHVRSSDGECKFWLEPMVILASNRGIPSHELREVERLVYQNQVLLRSAYRDFHNR